MATADVASPPTARASPSSSSSLSSSTATATATASQNKLLHLIGPQLLSWQMVAVPSEELLRGRTLLLLFSAAWCPPCKGFLESVVAWYQSARNSNVNAEVIFVSSDRNEASFLAYFRSMVWYALPYADRARKAMLTRRYKVTGIPALVVVAPDGTLITRDGRQAIMKNPAGFPWLPPSLRDVIGTTFLRTDGTTVDGAAFLGRKHVGLFFSSAWCPPCAPFKEELIRISDVIARKYGSSSNGDNNNDSGDNGDGGLQILFVSTDKGQEQFETHFRTMPPSFLALPFETERAELLSQILAVDGVPNLTILDRDLRVITRDGRTAVLDDPAAAEFPWRIELVNRLKGRHAQTINTTTSLILLAQDGVMTEQQILDALTPVARRCAAAAVFDDDFLFFYGTDEPLIAHLRTFAGDTHNPTCMIVSIAQNTKYVMPLAGSASVITAEMVAAFVESYLNGSSQGVSLGV